LWTARSGSQGGAGFADQWLYDQGHDPRWRDTVLRLEGGAAAGLDGTFSENWLEASGEMLVAPQYYPPAAPRGSATTLVVTSSPTSGRSSEARVLIQTLIAKAAHSIEITNPYFLPDKSLRQELAAAVRRGVDVRLLVPGPKADHLLTRRSSRALYGDPLRAGAPKTIVIDGLWALAGSTNLDSRSFTLNDELNIGIPDRTVATQLESDFENDLKVSRQISYQEWKSRPIWEWAEERLGWLLEKEQ
jgi:cardiolipin synthase